jgi:hypothetical protein
MGGDAFRKILSKWIDRIPDLLDANDTISGFGDDDGV